MGNGSRPRPPSERHLQYLTMVRRREVKGSIASASLDENLEGLAKGTSFQYADNEGMHERAVGGCGLAIRAASAQEGSFWGRGGRQEKLLRLTMPN
jgi:hypothetical protein